MLAGPPARFFQLTPSGSAAILLLAIALIPAAFSSAVTALYNAYEQLSLPAGIQLVTSVASVALGVAALLLGWGAAGLAGAALLTATLTALIFYHVLRRDFFPPGVHWSLSADRAMLAAGWPLMLNGLLIAIFFRFDQPIIQHYRPDDVALYEVAYKVINVTQIIAPTVVLALFPTMARAALHDRAALRRQYRGAVKFLLLLGLPLVAGTMLLAGPLITVVTMGKAGYLPYSAWALAILIAYLPFSCINGVTQYVLIALHRQSRLTGAVAATALFNVGANLLTVPVLGIYGAALVTIVSEVVLLVPFPGWAAQALGAGVLRPGAAGVKLVVAGSGLALSAALVLAEGGGELLAAAVAGGVYALVVGVLGVVHPAEWARIRALLGRPAATRSADESSAG